MLARLFVLVGGLLVLALTAALVGPYFVDWTGYRADFEREASAILGRKVTVKGDASARLLPFPSVTFTDVTVGADAAKPAMTVEEFSMDAELAPFMRGEVLIFDMRLVRPKATIEVADDGTVDWAVRPSTPFQASNITLEKLTITEGQVKVHHAASGRDHLLSEINAALSARALTGPWRVDGTFRLDGKRTALAASTGTVDEKGAMHLKVRANPDAYPVTVETEGDVRADKGQLRYAGLFKINQDTAGELRGSDGETFKAKGPRKPEKPEPGFRLAGNFSLDHKKLGIDEFRFETGPLDNPYTADGKAFVDLGAEPRFAVEATGAQVRFDEAVAGAAGTLTLEQRLAALERAFADLPKPAIPGSINVDLPAIVAGDTTIRDVKLAAEPSVEGWLVKSAAATLPGRTTLEASGTIATEPEFGFKGSLLLAVAQPSGFAAWVSKEVDDAIRRLPAAGFNAKVDLSPRRQSFSDLELVLGKARFHGAIDSAQPENARPSVLIKLDGEALDVDGLTAFASLFVSDTGANRFADRDLDFQIKAGPVSAGGLTAESVDTALRLREGQLEIDRLAIGGLAGASVSATGTIKDLSGNPTGNLDASVVAVDLAPLVALVAERYPDNALLKGLDQRAAGYAGLLSDAQIDVVASAAENSDGTTGVALSAQGSAGGSTISASLSGSGDASSPADVPLSLSVSAKNADATPLLALIGLPTVPLGMLGAGEMEVSGKGALASGLQTTARLTADDFSAAFDGTIAVGAQGPSAKGKATLEAGDIAPWLISIGVALPGMATGLPVTLAADADYGNKLLVLSQLDGAVDENAVSGDINAELKEGLPHLTGALQLDSLNLDPAFAMVLGEEQVGASDEPWPSVPFQQKALAPFSGELAITAASLSAGTLAQAYDANLSLKLDAEGVHVSGLTAKLYGGELSGLFDVKNNAGTGLFSSQMTLNGADLATALPDSGLTGTGNFTTSLTGSGKSVAGIIAELAGNGTAQFKGLAIDGLDPKALPAYLAKADAIGRDIDAMKVAAFTPEIAAGGSFAASDADVAFTVAGGVLRAPPTVFDNPDASLSTDLRADLNTGTVAATGTVAYRPGEEALVGSEPALRFTVEGMPGATVKHFDSEPLAQFLTQRALEIEQARVEAMQAALLEKQRLRREVRYYAFLQDERQRIADEMRRAEERIAAEAKARAEEEARLKSEAEAKATEEAQKAAEEAAKAKAEADAKAAEEAAKAKAAEDAKKAEEEAARQKAEDAIKLAEAEKARLEAEKKAAGEAPAQQRAPTPQLAPQRPLPTQEQFPPAPKPRKPLLEGLFGPIFGGQ